MSLRRFHEWFGQNETDLDRVEKPKLKKERYQNKVLCQVERTRFTAKQKLDLIQQFDKAKAADRSFTIKGW